MIDALRTAIARTAPDAGSRPRLVLRHGGGGLRDTDQTVVLDDRGQPILAVKSCRGERARALLRHEHERLARLASTLLVLRPGGVPRPVGFCGELGDRAFLVESFVPGRRLKDLDSREVERAHGPVEAVVEWLADFTRATGIEIVPLDGDGFVAHVERPVARYLASFETTSHEQALVTSIGALLRGAFGGGAPTVAQHGDFTDANVLVDGPAIGVVDWDEPVERALPCADLFYFLASIAATRHGLGDPAGIRRGFVESFFAPTGIAARNRRMVERYRRVAGLPRQAIRPLFALAWVRFALHKLDYLEESGLRHDPASSYPVTVFGGGRCLNVAWTAEAADAFEM